MKILVANLGSTSFKYKLYELANLLGHATSTGERMLAKGGVERIGSDSSKAFVEANGLREEMVIEAPDHAAAVNLCLAQLADPKRECLKNSSELAAIGFKAVMARGISGVRKVTDQLLRAMEDCNEIAPAHNPPYVAAMRLLSQKLPEIPLVAAFETGFHQTIPDSRKIYAIPLAWSESYCVKRWGFHGASHRYIGQRTAEILNRPDLKVISCHLGGSSSLCAISGGQSIANSLGMSPQTGIPHNNRVGDFDPFALPVIMRGTGKTLEQVLADLATRSGLFGISGHNDLRDIETAAANEEPRAKLALDIFIEAVRHYLGSYLVALGGADAIVFTGGIGENSVLMRQAICANLGFFGISVDPKANIAAKGEASFHAPESRVQLWTMPTNEELMVARQTRDLLLAD